MLVTLVLTLSLQLAFKPGSAFAIPPSPALCGPARVKAGDPARVLKRTASRAHLADVLMSDAAADALVERSTDDSAAETSPAPAIFDDVSRNDSPVRIQVVGVGGGGSNTVSRMIDMLGESAKSLRFASMNTDQQALTASKAELAVQLGALCTRGLGAGGKPQVGRQAALESQEAIETAVADYDLVFITAGMGGGTGSGAAPVVAKLAREASALVVSIVTRPFTFEGAQRHKQAEESIEALLTHSDILIVVSNDRLLQIMPEGIPMADAFLVADEILRQGVVGLGDILTKPGLINIDFADVRRTIQSAGQALLGIGRGEGPNRARDAATAALSSPLLEVPLNRARRVVYTICGPPEMSLAEVSEVGSTIEEFLCDADANIIFGTTIDESMQEGELVVTIIATDLADLASAE
jgi:cell division protein FtsZ|tara:strand:- start:2124 stop:3356 length:1233 start_codon:yes stop_codon:yes gene_type:complete